MRIAKPLLLITTPIGLAGGLYEAFRLAGGLAFIMVALITVIGAAISMLVVTIQREHKAEAARLSALERRSISPSKPTAGRT